MLSILLYYLLVVRGVLIEVTDDAYLGIHVKFSTY